VNSLRRRPHSTGNGCHGHSYFVGDEPDPSPNPEKGSPRESVEAMVRHVAELFIDSTFSVCIPALIEGAERDARLRKFHYTYSAERRKSLTDVIAEGIADGEFPSSTDLELATLALLGPIIHSRLMAAKPFDPRRAADLVALVLGHSRP
jgi:TetR/AcrR family transcriptional regulator of autoinduction and epiphytic fitness